MSFLEGLLWLTLNVYHEARSEPQIGQVAIAHVTLNRASNEDRTVKEVVKKPYQFSWTFQKKSYVPGDLNAFFKCMESVYIALQTQDFTKGATHYHLASIHPSWSSSLTYVNQYGSHKFYKQ